MIFTIDERIKSEGGATMASLWPTGVVSLQNWRMHVVPSNIGHNGLIIAGYRLHANEP